MGNVYFWQRRTYCHALRQWHWIFFDEESYDFNIDKFEYIYNKKTEKINIIFWNGQTEVYEIEAIGNDKMIIIRDLDSSKYFCKKINSPYTASQLEKIFQKNMAAMIVIIATKAAAVSSQLLLS